jgi:hypothetical protein
LRLLLELDKGTNVFICNKAVLRKFFLDKPDTPADDKERCPMCLGKGEVTWKKVK